jgi:pimeloyl-ACP methyl ester carboxylesterase
MALTLTLLRTTLNTASLLAPGLTGRAAFGVFVRPRGRSRLRPTEARALAEARTGHLTVNANKVVTYRWGDGRRPVLLVHGWESRASRLAGFATALRDKGLTPLAFDAPGHGESAGRTTNILEYREIIRQLSAGYGPFEAVVAHSFGFAATCLALRDAEVRADRVVGIGGVAELGYLVEGFCAGLGLHDRLKRELRRRTQDMFLPDERDVWRRFSATHRPEEIGLPILLVHDDNDETVPVAQSLAVAAAHGDRARLVTTRGLGHRRILADPDVVSLVAGFAAAGNEQRAA